MKHYLNTHISLLTEAEVPLEDIIGILGNTNDDTTRFVYRHVTKESNKKTSRKFGQLIGSLKNPKNVIKNPYISRGFRGVLHHSTHAAHAAHIRHSAA